jgi:two-component system chemotaxis response regulator CheB
VWWWVVDESALVRSLLGAIINRQSDMECEGAAAHPLIAREMIRTLDPDVITLDVEMPSMDGIDFLAKLMRLRLRPTPVVMVSTLTERGAEVTLRALELGAIDFVAKPKIGLADGLQLLAQEITDKVRIASKARLRKPAPGVPGSIAGGTTPSLPAPPVASLGRLSTEKIVFVGASTGGTEATKEVLVHLPPTSRQLRSHSTCRPVSRRAMPCAWTACAASASPKRAMANASCPAMPTSHPAGCTSAWNAVAGTTSPGFRKPSR